MIDDVTVNQRACGVPSMQLFLHGMEGTISAELTALAGIGSKNRGHHFGRANSTCRHWI
jgi:hypothetical protein